MSPDRARVLTEGLVAGFIGYLVVAVFFAVVNVLMGRPVLYTAALLGGLLTGTGTDPAAVTVQTGPVLAYNAVHLVVFLTAGLLASALILATERRPNLWVLFFLIFVALFMVSAMAFALLIGRVSAGLPWWSLIGANLAATIAMGAYLVARHPGLPRTVGEAEV